MTLNLRSNKGDKRHPGQEKVRQYFWCRYYYEACRRVRHLNQILDRMEKVGMSTPRSIYLPERDYEVLELADLDIANGLESRKVRPNNLKGIANRAAERYTKAQEIFEREYDKVFNDDDDDDSQYYIGSEANWNYIWDHL